MFITHMSYEIAAHMGDIPCESSYWFNSVDLKNHLSTSMITSAEANDKSNKRKRIENEENEIID
jgi:hypothetical protein